MLRTYHWLVYRDSQVPGHELLMMMMMMTMMMMMMLVMMMMMMVMMMLVMMMMMMMVMMVMMSIPNFLSNPRGKERWPRPCLYKGRACHRCR